MVEINLLKSEQKKRLVYFSDRSKQSAVYILLALLILELLLYGYLVFDQRRTGKEILKVEQEEADTNLEFGKLDRDRLKAISFQSRLHNLGFLLKNHLFFSESLKELEKYTYVKAKYDSLEVDEVGHKFILSGMVATQTDLAKLMLGLKTSSNIQEVKLSSNTRGKDKEAGYNFGLEVTFDPKLLLK